MYAVSGLAQVEYREGNYIRASELASCLLYTRNVPFELRQEIEKLLAQLEAVMPPDEYAAAVERGKALTFETVFEKLSEA